MISGELMSEQETLQAIGNCRIGKLRVRTFRLATSSELPDEEISKHVFSKADNESG
jgi:hypothetical protein